MLQKSSSSSSDLSADLNHMGKWKGDVCHNAHRNVIPRYEKSCTMLPPYIARTKYWDANESKQYEGDLAFLPMYEVLENVVHEDAVSDWCSFSPDQEEFKHDLRAACERLGTACEDNMVAT